MREYLILLTYLFYIVIWEVMCIGGCGYVVFGLHYSGWWFVLAAILSAMAYSPEKWNELLKK